MPTVDSVDLVKGLIFNHGYYYDDPQVLTIYAYINSWGKWCYSLCYSQQDVIALFTSPYVNDITKLWDRDAITPAGCCFLDGTGFIGAPSGFVSYENETSSKPVEKVPSKKEDEH